MSTENTAEQFVSLIQRYICLRPKMILPEHVIQFRKKMDGFKSKSDEPGDHPEDYSFLFRILILLAQSEKPMTMRELGAELNVPMSTATRIVDWLVRGGMVERVNDPNDRRVVRVSMSKSGSELYKAGMGYNRQRIANLLKDFSTKEQMQLLKLMNKLFTSLVNESERQK
jgi:DNA-binding MarR family transcriptional regulator